MMVMGVDVSCDVSRNVMLVIATPLEAGHDSGCCRGPAADEESCGKGLGTGELAGAPVIHRIGGYEPWQQPWSRTLYPPCHVYRKIIN